MYNQILLISLKINLPLKLMLIFKVICSLMTYDIVNGLNENTTHRYILVDLFGLPGQGYYMTVFTGTPGQKMNLLIDTGSSNIAISGRNLTNVDSWFKLNQSSTLQCSNSVQKVRYELGFWYGIYCQDDFDFENAQNTINLDATINSYQISLPFGLIFNSTRLFLRHNHSSWYGIIGLAFTSLYVKPNKIFSNRNTKYAVKNSQVKSTNQALLKP
ncbi:unnamed protein product [Heterobilharzia americana]|nr:unnamed protein product [Heterobilharzia americana]